MLAVCSRVLVIATRVNYLFSRVLANHSKSARKPLANHSRVLVNHTALTVSANQSLLDHIYMYIKATTRSAYNNIGHRHTKKKINAGNYEKTKRNRNTVMYKYCRAVHFFLFNLRLASSMAHTHCAHAVFSISLVYLSLPYRAHYI